MLERDCTPRKWESMFENKVSRSSGFFSDVVSAGGGGGAEVVAVWDMHRVVWKERCDVRSSVRKVRRLVFCDMLAGSGELCTLNGRFGVG